MAANGILEFQGTEKAIFRGSNSNIVIDTANSSFGVGVDTPTSNLHIVGKTSLQGDLNLVQISNVANITVNSNVVTEYTGPHDRPLRKYPEVALTANSDKGYVVTRSSIYNGNWEGYKAFNEQRGTNLDWLSAGHYVDGVYNKTNGDTGYAYLQDTSGVKYEGEWITLRIPKTIRLKKFSLVDRDGEDFTYRLPKDGALLGSNDGTNWEIVLRWTNRTFYTDVENFFYVNTDKYYSHFGLVGEALANVVGAITWDMGEIKYYGYEEGDASLDTTLKTVYNVPATTGTQLEVYYDGQDYTADTDFDQANEVLDKSGNNLHGSQTGGVGFDSTYKAFTFDGSGDSISRVITNSQGAYVHSWSAWVKLDTSSGQILWHLGLDGTGGTGGSDTSSIYIEPDGSLSWFWWSNDVKFSNQKLITGTWYHLAGSYNGGAPISSRKLWINGIEQVISSTSGSQLGTALGLEANTTLRLGTRYNGGGFLDGSIANFRLYSKALNADQVKELYDYQKDYFLGSKSQVTLYKGHLGVGVTEPSGQLELAGDERIQEYPPRGMTDFDTYIEGHGVFTASATTYGATSATKILYHPWKAFNKDRTDDGNGDNSWLNGPDISGGDYNSTTGVYEGTEKHHEGAPIGAALQLSMPYEIYLKGYSLAPWNYATGTDFQYADSPSDFIIYGSKDNVNWKQIDSRTGQGMISQADIKRFSLDTQDSYSHFAIVVTKINTAAYPSTPASFVAIEEWRLFGTPGPTTLDKGSLSLTRSLDVPRVSRYDVDTETPRPEKLVVDFDTTVNDSPTDISGRGNHGVMHNYSGAPTYSVADKAFNFIGVNGVIYSGTLSPAMTGDRICSMSCWFKATDAANINIQTLMWLGAYSGGGFIGLLLENNQLKLTIGGDRAIKTTSSPIQSNQWYHVVAIKSGTGQINSSTANGYFQIYINGEKSTDATFQNEIGTLNITINYWYVGAASALGQEPFSGYISNPKLYDVALEPSEVKKLYNLGRTGRSMVIGDTAVGIGKVPEAQLDVRGNLNVSSFIKYDSAWFYAYDGNTDGTGSFNDYTGFVPWASLEPGSNHFTTASASTSGGYYTAPVDGIYHFDTSVLNYPNARSGITGIHFSVNDRTDGTYYSSGYNRKYDMNGQESINASVTIKLNKGDTVKVYVVNIDCYTESNHAFFSGYLITRI